MIKGSTSTFFLLLFGALVFSFIIIRCFTVPPFIDEVINYFTYVRPGEIIPFNAYPDANNHVLSTAFNLISYKLFGQDFAYMRLFEALSFVLYFFYSLKLSRFLEAHLLRICFVLTLNSSLLILSFFSLARGYGMALAFVLGVLFHLLSFYNSKKRKDLILLMFYSLMGIWVNFVLLPVTTLAFIAAFFLVFKGEKSLFKDKAVLTMLFVYASLTVYAVVYVFYLKSIGGLWIGGKTGFIHDIILNITYRSLGPKGIWALGGIAFLTLGGFLLSFDKIRLTKNLKLVGFLFLGTLLGTIGLHIVLGVNYPRNRAAIHFIVLGIVFAFFLIDIYKPRFKRVGLVLPIVFLGHALLNLNLSYPLTWKEYTLSPDLYQSIQEEASKNEKRLTISAPYGFGLVYNYYSYLNEDGATSTQWVDYPSHYADLLIIDVNEQFSHNNEFDTIGFNEVSNISILSRKKKVEWSNLKTEKFGDQSSQEDSILLAEFNLPLDSAKIPKVEFDAYFQCASLVKNGVVSIVFYDENGIEKGNEGFSLNQAYNGYTSPQRIHFSFYYPYLTPQNYRVKIVINNPRNHEWEVNKIKVTASLTKELILN